MTRAQLPDDPATFVADAQLPDDPAAFVAEAQRVTNRPDLDALDGLYAANAVFELVGDGVYERHLGGAHCADAWKALLSSTAGLLAIEKSLLGVTRDAIVNEWTGTVGGRPTRGIEHWRFDGDGNVVHHRIYQTISARDSRDPRARVRALFNHPLLALRLLRARRRLGGDPNG